MPYSIQETLFFINPYSGSGNYKKIIASLKKEDKNINYHISTGKSSLNDFFLNIANKYKVIVICGGDGTINSILPYTKNSHLVFAVLPNGSGNGFAREMAYSKNVEKMLATIKRGEIRKIDVVTVNNNYCCNLAGIGFDSYIADRFDKSGKRGLITYILESIKGFLKYPQINAQIQADDTILEGRYFMLTIANTRQFGNNAIIAPNANPSDGLLDLVAIKSFPKRLTPFIILKIMGKQGKNSKYISYLKANEITIKSDFGLYHVDGEAIKETNTTLIARIEHTMNVLTNP